MSRGDSELAVQLLSVTRGALKLRSPYRIALELARSVENLAGLLQAAAQRLARVHGHILMTAGHMTDADAHDLYACALQSAQATDDQTVQCNVLSGLGKLYLCRSDLEPAQSYPEQAPAPARRAGHRRLEGGALGKLGHALNELGRHAEARERHVESLAIALERGNRRERAASVATSDGSTMRKAK